MILLLLWSIGAFTLLRTKNAQKQILIRSGLANQIDVT